MKAEACRGLERSLIEGDAGASVCRLERQRDQRLLVVGVGGIDASNAAEVIEAGAAGVAVVSSVGAAEDPVAATRAIGEAVRKAKDVS